MHLFARIYNDTLKKTPLLLIFFFFLFLLAGRISRGADKLDALIVRNAAGFLYGGYDQKGKKKNPPTLTRHRARRSVRGAPE